MINLILQVFVVFYHFSSCTCGYKGKVKLGNNDFVGGTYRITESDMLFVLKEDIIFNPKSDYDVSPNEENAYYPSIDESDIFPGSDRTPGSFRLGFFSAISIEANDITLDLNGHSIKCHPEFHIQQRFFNLIEVGKGPFIDGQGPSSFGEDFSVSNIIIKNGKLGLSAHNGIHGNFVHNVEVYNLKIHDFEVTGIQFNGFSNVKIHDIEIGPSLIGVPVVGRYSQARFGLLSFNSLQNGDNANNHILFSDRTESTTVYQIIENLRIGMDLFFKDKILNQIDYKQLHGITNIDDSNRGSNSDSDSDSSDDDCSINYYKLYIDALKIFHNKDGLPDGSALTGILLNSIGVGVNWFGSADGKSNNALIYNIHIHDLNLKVNEIIGYKNENNQIITGPYGGVLPMKLLLDLDNFIGSESWTLDSFHTLNLPYHGNILSDAQIALGLYGEDDEFEKAGTTINDEIINWAANDQTLFESGKLIANGDDMFHMNKGIIGIRIDNVNDAHIEHIKIEYINNWSEFGTELLDSIHQNGINKTYNTHSQAPSYGKFQYYGGFARGISITDSDVKLTDIKINQIGSARSSANGIDLLGDDEFEVELSGDIIISNIQAGLCLTEEEKSSIIIDEVPNGNVEACAFHISNMDAMYDDNDVIDVSVVDVNGPNVCTEGF